MMVFIIGGVFNVIGTIIKQFVIIEYFGNIMSLKLPS